jgi:glycine/D-amino acid oxidase-like deaminating enzyme
LEKVDLVGMTRGSALVLGGGVAGLEAARTLALRGWQVEIHEAEPCLGGKLRWMAELPGLERHQGLLAWYERELHRFGVIVHLNSCLSPAKALFLARENRRHALLLATGVAPAERLLQRAWPIGPQIKAPAASCGAIDHILRHPPGRGTSFVLVDDSHGHRGLTVACWLQDRGVQVKLVTSQPVPGSALAGTGMQTSLRQRFALAGGHVYADTVLLTWDGHNAQLRNLLLGDIAEVRADYLTWSCTHSEENLVAPVCDEIIQVHVIGDAAGERDAEQAILEAHQCALRLHSRPTHDTLQLDAAFEGLAS